MDVGVFAATVKSAATHGQPVHLSRAP